MCSSAIFCGNTSKPYQFHYTSWYAIFHLHLINFGTIYQLMNCPKTTMHDKTIRSTNNYYFCHYLFYRNDVDSACATNPAYRRDICDGAKDTQQIQMGNILTYVYHWRILL